MVEWPRDSIYGAIILLGAGGAFVNVLSMTMIAYVIGPYAVSVKMTWDQPLLMDILENFNSREVAS